jgi:hypothetical protein
MEDSCNSNINEGSDRVVVTDMKVSIVDELKHRLMCEGLGQVVVWHPRYYI